MVESFKNTNLAKPHVKPLTEKVRANLSTCKIPLIILKQGTKKTTTKNWTNLCNVKG